MVILYIWKKNTKDLVTELENVRKMRRYSKRSVLDVAKFFLCVGSMEANVIAVSAETKE